MKRLFFILAAALMTASVMAENYRVDSLYHYSIYHGKQVIHKTVYHYNSNNQKVQSDSYYMQDGKWSKGTTTTYEYNSNGLLEKTTEINENRRGIAYSQKIYTYKDTLVTLIEERRKVDTAGWKITGYEEYEYNEQNLMIRDTRLHSTRRKWFQDEYLYDPFGNKIQHDVVEWDNGEFRSTVRTVYTYNEKNLLIQEKIFIQDKLSEQSMYEYDANNFLIQVMQYLEFEGVLVPSMKISYKNDKEGKVLRELLYSNGDIKGEFVLGSKTEYTYDSRGNKTSKTVMLNYKGTWYPSTDSDEMWVYYYSELK